VLEVSRCYRKNVRNAVVFDSSHSKSVDAKIKGVDAKDAKEKGKDAKGIWKNIPGERWHATTVTGSWTVGTFPNSDS
jgi:hypothetical protein